MIRTFNNSETEAIWDLTFTKRVGPQLAQRARVKLQLLDAAGSLEDLRIPPGNRLEKLSGDREGQHSIRVNSQWRICFRWDEGAFDVELVDYH
ncbi:type II toxin-antitoxin system RelE/ParE family toxin [Tsukamurella pseudospumae]|uniref:Plasmid maintenance system killer protein n=1 Tax=Tsukamurella pseudospumae TaxID=239498 RepID=A0A138A494_9ACTN|nr:type II toxin-antitoxin system RelE/ParE family toxin [Tsukamurella pseudospumae]KXO98811.1 plasmid maintenance system killer protein [Tsukamurella pseudospumae]KXP05232.1 plasmid maintenance system killer protein [Tsukamurella pseudospumae]